MNKTPIQKQIESAVTNGRGYLESEEVRAESIRLGLKMLNREQSTPEYLEMIFRKRAKYLQDQLQDLLSSDNGYWKFLMISRIPTDPPLDFKEGRLGITIDNFFQPIVPYRIRNK